MPEPGAGGSPSHRGFSAQAGEADEPTDESGRGPQPWLNSQVHFYETDRAVAEYLLFHYGSREQTLSYDGGPVGALEFPVRCVTECVETSLLAAEACALDLGCAVGRASFELARICSRVVAIDYSKRFIAVAGLLRATGKMDFSFVEEGEITCTGTARVPEEIDRERVAFEEGDATDLRADLGTFDVVLMANLIDRLAEPLRCLRRLPQLVKPRGQLIIISPYTWMTEFTPRENWLGGYGRAGQPFRTLEALREILAPDFEWVSAKDLPFLIREHARKYQWSVAEASIWRRK